jgi:hypothetical protein
VFLGCFPSITALGKLVDFCSGCACSPALLLVDLLLCFALLCCLLPVLLACIALLRAVLVDAAAALLHAAAANLCSHRRLCCRPRPSFELVHRRAKTPLRHGLQGAPVLRFGSQPS